MTRRLAVLGVPSSAGAYAPGQEQAPAALRAFGLIEHLRARGVSVADLGDSIEKFRWRPDPAHPLTPHLDAVVDAAVSVRDRVAQATAGDATAMLVVGGDCTVGIGTVAGFVGEGTVGLVYIDGDVDLNTPVTGDGPLDWTGVAHMLDVDGVAGPLAAVGSRRPLLEPDSVLLVGASNITPAEQQTIDRLRVRVIPYETVTDDPKRVAEQATAWAARFDRIVVHVDMDVLDYLSLPLAVGTATDRRPGLRPEELAVVLRALCALPSWRALTVTEIDPSHAPDPARELGRLIELIGDAIAPDARRP